MKHSRPFWAVAIIVLCLLTGTLILHTISITREPETFLIKPYIQLGNTPSIKEEESLTLVWATLHRNSNWLIQTKSLQDPKWHTSNIATIKQVSSSVMAPFWIYTAALQHLLPGKAFTYRILKNSKIEYIAQAMPRKGPTQPYRFVAVGDIANGSHSQKKVAYQAYLAKPDFVFVAGDIVYQHGRLSEYLRQYFPVYNADEPSPVSGAPLIRSTLFVAAPGNHDIGTTGKVAVRDLNRFPDGLAYFILWKQPLNGPVSTKANTNVPSLIGTMKNQATFMSAADQNYPRMANFSFDYGNSHWTVLDGNDYMDWTDTQLRSWLENDLATAENATWRFVGFHQSPFSSDKGHFEEQRMRLVADIFERGKVDVVFTGHMHNYQRTFPLRFQIVKHNVEHPIAATGEIFGTLDLDKAFDGRTHTKPNGVIYLVTGSGGAGLSGLRQAANPAGWQPYTCRFIADKHSYTVCDVNDKLLTVRQISEEGAVIDEFVVRK